MDKATATARKSIAEKKKRAQVLERLEEQEFISRCNAMGMCYKCGRDWNDVAAFSSHHISWACTNKRCSEYNVTKKHIYPNGRMG